MVLAVPTLMSYFFLDNAFPAFAYTALATTLTSCAVWLLTFHFRRELRPRDGFTLVLMLWLAFALVAAMPIYIHIPGISFTDAFFEAMSGLTTTGATVMTSLDTLAPSVNFWRHMLNWLGGMGIIVLAVAILPMLGVGGTQLFKAEIPGMDKESKMAEDDVGFGKPFFCGFDVGNGQIHICAGNNDDGIFFVGNGNVCHAAVLSHDGLDIIGTYAFVAEVGYHFQSEIVVADCTDDGYACT